MGNTVAIVQGKIIRIFAEANAFNKDTAKTLKELNLENRYSLMLNSLIRRGIIIKAFNGKYYLDYDYYQKHQDRKKMIIPILCVCLFLYFFIYLGILCLT